MQLECARRLGKALLGDRRERRSVGRLDVDADGGAAATSRSAQPVGRGNDQRVANPAGKQAAPRQGTKISRGDGSRGLPNGSIWLAQLDRYAAVDRGLLYGPVV